MDSCGPVLASQPPLTSQKMRRRHLRLQICVAGSGTPELATTRNRGRDDFPAYEKACSLEDEDDDAFSIGSELPYQGQGNSAPEGDVSPNPLNEVVNPTPNSNGKPEG